MEIYKECEKIKEQIKDYAFEVYGIDLDGLYSISESIKSAKYFHNL